MGLIITIAQFLLSLSILVILHECGHYFPAKWFKTKVEKFFLFMDVNIGEWDGALVSKQKGETKFGIGWLPLGGYVKIAGMVDESFDTESLKEEPKPWEFRSKPAWQRLIIMTGGVIVNFILGVLIFAMILTYWGESYVLTENAKFGIVVDSLGQELGLQDGDLVLKVDDVEMTRFEPSMVKQEISISSAKEVTIKRNGTQMTIPVPEGFDQRISTYENRNNDLFSFAHPNVIAEVREESNAEKAGLKVADQIIGINGKHTPFYLQFAKEMRSIKNQKIDIDVLRGTDTISLDVMADENGTIGYYARPPGEFIPLETEKYSIIEALPMGYRKSVDFISLQIKAFGQMIRGERNPNDSLGSLISIGGLFGPRWDWERFWKLTASLSILLGFMNLLPIPALDGGHVMFLLWEIITGRKPSDRFLEYATMLGFLLLIVLMAYALGLDIFRAITSP